MRVVGVSAYAKTMVHAIISPARVSALLGGEVSIVIDHAQMDTLVINVRACAAAPRQVYQSKNSLKC